MSTLVNMLKSGDHIVCMNDVYGGTNRYFSKVIVNMGIETTFVDMTVLDNLQTAFRPNTKVPASNGKFGFP